MPEMTPKRQQKPPPLDLTEARRLRAERLSYDKIAKQLGSSFGTVYRALNAASTNGDVPALSAPVHPDASERISALESIDSARLREIVARLEVVESFMLAQQALTASAAH